MKIKISEKQRIKKTQTWTLTVGEDRLTGTTDDDVFNAQVVQNNQGVSVDTIEDIDILDGGAGNDTLNVTLTQNAAPILSDIENVNVRFAENTNKYFKLGNSTGVEQVIVSQSTVASNIGQVGDIATLGIKNQNQGVTFYKATAESQNLVFDTVGKIMGGSDQVTVNVVSSATSANISTANANVEVSRMDSIKTLAIDASGANVLDLSASESNVETINVIGNGFVDLSGASFSAVETLDASANAGGVKAKVGSTAIDVTTGAGDDSIEYTSNVTKDAVVKLGEGDDTVNAGGKNVNAGARIELGAGDDAVTNLGTVDKNAVIDGGAGTDTLQLQAVASANVGAFQNFEVFDVAALDKTLDMNILNDENDVQEVIGSAALGGASELVNLGAGVGFRATGDMGSSDALTLTQATAGALDVTLDADQAATAAANANNDADTSVVASNATSVNVAFDSESVNEIAGAITNTQTIKLTTGAAESITVVSGGENAANVLDLTDTSANDAGDAGLLENIVITGDQDLTLEDIGFSGNGGTASVIESIDASDLTGALTADLSNLANGGVLELGSGADRITVDNTSTVEEDDTTGANVETIVGFEKSASTTDADMIKDADQLAISGTATVAGDTTSTDSGTGVEYEIVDGVLSFNGAGVSTLEEAFKVADAAAGNAADDVGNALAFEFTGDTYAFVEVGGTTTGTADTLVKLAGVTDVDSLNANAGGDLYIA